MFFKAPTDSKAQVTVAQALRHLLVFQLKLAADALRDLLLSPVSLVVFLIDIINKPALEDSLYLRLMLLGRRSDRVVNLFDEHKDAGHFTVDRAMEELEVLVIRRGQGKKMRSKGGRKSSDRKRREPNETDENGSDDIGPD
ncbi:MAG: hypothetical protein ACI9JM_001830 [Halioglobus sp.]|jgi:hypothetical protein